ncbi:MAG: heavy metal translocating P-type ATPase [Acidobacteriota bacterium]
MWAWIRKRKTWLLTVSGVLLGAGLVLELRLQQHFYSQLTFAVSALLAGPDIFRVAWKSLKERRLGMNFLMTIAAVGAFGTGHGEEGAAVLFLFAIAEGLEEYAETRAHSSIGKLLQLAPSTASVRRDGEEVQVPTEEVRPGETILLRPGEKIPLDGIVREGSSSVDQAAITGESVPVEKGPGSSVFAASLVNDGYLEVEVSKASSETLLARIVALIEGAEKHRSRTERFVDRFARLYTPTVVALAVATAIIPPLAFGLSFSAWLYRALVLLVVSCPCALAISTPVSFVSALTSAARQGVLIKGAEYVEAIRSARVFAFDKTGTLTQGRLAVDSVMPLGEGAEAEMIRIAAAIESRSLHPVGQAIVGHARQIGLDIDEVEDFISTSGKGVTATYRGTRYLLGNAAFLAERGLTVPAEIVARQQGRGTTVVLLASEEKLLACIGVSDQPRSAAVEAVRVLHRHGFHTVMLTGDARRTAEAMATQVGIDEVHAELLPEDKVDAVKRLGERYGGVVVVGDGVNDAPALAEASVGIAMGVAGTDVALETADIALMEDDLGKLPYLVELSSRTLRVVRQNIVASISIKGTLGLLALQGMVSLWVAVAIGDMGLSLAVILNALRVGLLHVGAKR